MNVLKSRQTESERNIFHSDSITCSSLEHQRADWAGIHGKICEDLIPLRKPIPFQTSEDARRLRKTEITEQKVRNQYVESYAKNARFEPSLSLLQRKMIDLTLKTGQKFLFENKHESAVPAALQSLKFSIDVHGLASVELVPSYLILGEASIGEKPTSFLKDVA